MQYQKTITREVSFSGIALHTGEETCITFKPSPADTGIKFIRLDLPGRPEIKACVTNVSNIIRGTNIGNEQAKIYTVEHLLAAFLALGIDNIVVEMNASEPPVGDGSALTFVDMIRQAGAKEQKAPRRICVLKQSFWVSDNGSMLMVVPSDRLKISCTIAYNHPEVRAQYITVDIDEEIFKKEIAPARTFCFYHEVEKLMDQGLIKGGSLDNAVVIGDESIFSKEQLRYPDEFVRHKVLDLLGDLCLMGKPIQAHIIAIKPGHNINIKMVKKIYDSVIREKEPLPVGFSPSGDTLLDINQIKQVLPHRYPFLLVDRILEITDKKAVGVKNVTVNEQFFNGHFPGKPIMPGVLIVEAMAQVAGILMLKKSENVGKMAYFMSIDKVKFRKLVVPGDQLRLEVELVKARSKTGKIRGKAYVGNDLVTEADLMFGLVDP